EDVLPLAERREGEPRPVRRERALGVEELQLLEVGVERALDETRDALPRTCVGEPEVDEDLALEEAPVGEEGDVVAVGRERGRDEYLSAAVALGEQWAREAPRPLEVGDLREMLVLHRLAPFVP